MRIGVIGAGLMGTTHARILSAAVSGAEVVAISDAVRDSAERSRPRSASTPSTRTAWS